MRPWDEGLNENRPVVLLQVPVTVLFYVTDFAYLHCANPLSFKFNIYPWAVYWEGPEGPAAFIERGRA